jgi:hypothetical protein
LKQLYRQRQESAFVVSGRKRKTLANTPKASEAVDFQAGAAILSTLHQPVLSADSPPQLSTGIVR